MNDRINVKYGNLFPWPFRLIAILVLLVGLSLVFEKTFLSVALMLIGGFILSASEGTEIDKHEKSYRDYKAFFFIKSGEKKKYDGIEKIFVSTSKTRQHFYTAHTNHGSTYEHLEFNGFLKLQSGEKIQLLRKRKKSDLINDLKKVAAFLNVPLEDNTGVA